jgi:hypothetical protein
MLVAATRIARTVVNFAVRIISSLAAQHMRPPSGSIRRIRFSIGMGRGLLRGVIETNFLLLRRKSEALPNL